jgi:hypothetical protein
VSGRPGPARHPLDQGQAPGRAGAGGPDAIVDQLGLDGVDAALSERVVVGRAGRSAGREQAVIVPVLGASQVLDWAADDQSDVVPGERGRV